MMKRIVVTFGEIMGRLDMPHQTKYMQQLPGEVRYSFAGSEANVAASVSYMGQSARFVTALPNHEIGKACMKVLRGLGVDVEHILLTNGRLGLYYVETGANQRPSKVIYDREHSAVCSVTHTQFDWDAIFAGASWFHTSGITPAISRQSAENTVAICKAAKEKGLTVSCDLNFRKKLWLWEPGTSAKELAQKTMSQVLPYVDVLIANEEDSSDILGIHPSHSDVTTGTLVTNSYVEVAQQIVERFPNIKQVATTLRESISSSHNNWGAMLYDAASRKSCLAPLDPSGNYKPYQIRNIIDRVGGGDSFAGGLIYALNSDEYNEPEKALRFATAASCLCHSIQGDFNYSSREEVELLMGGDASGRVQR